MNRPALTLIPKPPEVSKQQLSCPDKAVREALKRVVTSKQFAKARRCTALLTYLVERVLMCDDPDASPPEHEIGVAVFGRDPASYCPADDPIVRVQAGRLRLRLTAYYADEGAADAIRLTVPQGRYHARIALADAQPGGRSARVAAPFMMFSPLTCVSGGAPAGHFTAGLNDELGFRLYRDLPSLSLAGRSSGLPDQRPRALHVLEGTVRQDALLLRVSLILRRGEDGAVLWHEQFDSAGDGSIGSQEQMAERCVAALRRHLPD